MTEYPLTIVQEQPHAGRNWRKVEPRLPLYLELLRRGRRRGRAAMEVGLDRTTIGDYRNAHSWFKDAEIEAELFAHERVEEAMYMTALQGNVTAQQVWLYNRLPGTWADRRNVTMTGRVEGRVEVEHRLVEEPLAVRVAKTMEILERAGRLPAEDE